MTLRLRKHDITPPPSAFGKGWHHVTADGTLIIGGDRGDLIKHVMEYRIANGLPFDNIDAEIDDWMCRNTEARCKPAETPSGTSGRKIKVSDVSRFLWAMGEWVKNIGFVPQEEAERRAEICAGCINNQDVDDAACWGCAHVFSRIAAVIGGRTTKMDESLKFCAICSCSNTAQCHVPIEVLRKASGDLEYPTSTTGREPETPCWKRLPSEPT